MLSSQRFQPTRRARALVAALLLVALCVHGVAGALAAMLGSRHVHRQVVTAAVAPAMAGWQDFRRSARALDGVPRAARAHSHGLFERHRHDVPDASVVALDGGADDADTAPATAGMFGLPPPRLAPGAMTDPERRIGWPPAGVGLIASRDPDRLERPPRG